MSDMPRKARVYWWLVCIAGVAAVCYSQMAGLPIGTFAPWELLVFFGVSLLAGGQKVSLSRLGKDEETGSMSLGFAITFAALLRLGPGPAVVIALLSCLSSCVFPHRQPWHQLFFNLLLSAIEALVGGLIFLLLNGWTLEAQVLRTFVAAAGASLGFYLTNTIGVATIIALYSDQKLRDVWRTNFLWTAPSYFASASIGALALLAFSTNAAAILLFILPIAYFVYQSYVTYIGRAEEKQAHIEALQEKQTQLAELYLSTIRSLALAIDAKDQYTHRHIIRVQKYAVAIAEEMGLVGDDLQAVQTGALLHDIGKLGVPEFVLLKPGRLTAEEYDKIRKHPEIGAAILSPVDFPWPVLPIVRHHHEKWDGSGYPDGLKGEDIPLTARIMAVADVYDALTSTRSYRKAWTHERALDTIVNGAGVHFDPKVVEAFLRVIGSVVEEIRLEEKDRDEVGEQSEAPGQVASDAVLQISRASTELWALYEVAQSLSNSLSLADIVGLVSRKVTAIYSDTACVFMIWQSSSRRLVAGFADGFNRDYFSDSYTPSDASRSVRVLRSKQTYHGAYDSDDLMFSSMTPTEWIAPQTALIVPIWYEDKPLATLNLYHTSERAFSDYDREFLEMIAERTAPALFNGMLFEQTRGDSLTDPLTGVSNLRHLSSHVEALCAADRPFALIALDLDSFKPINDGFGHARGDIVLRDVAQTISEIVGEQGLVARHGGDEFVVVLHCLGPDQANAIARTIQKSIADYVPDLDRTRHGEIHLGASFGCASFPHDGHDLTTVLTAADQRMYAQKTERKLEALATRPASVPTELVDPFSSHSND